LVHTMYTARSMDLGDAMNRIPTTFFYLPGIRQYFFSRKLPRFWFCL